MTSHLFSCEVTDDERRKKAACCGEKVYESEDACGEIRRQILRVLAACHGCSAVKAEGKRDQQNAHARAILDEAEAEQQYSRNYVRFKEIIELQIDAD